MLGRRMKVVVRERPARRWRGDGETLLHDLAVGLWRWRVELAGAVVLVVAWRLLARGLGDVPAAVAVAALAAGVLVEPRSRRWLLEGLGRARVRRSWDHAVVDAGAAASPWRAPRVVSIARAPIGDVLRVRVQRGFSVAELEARCEQLAACLRVREVRVQREAGDGSLAQRRVGAARPVRRRAGAAVAQGRRGGAVAVGGRRRSGSMSTTRRWRSGWWSATC